MLIARSLLSPKWFGGAHTSRFSGFVAVTLLLALFASVLPANAQVTSPNNVEKSGVAQSPVGSTTETLEGTLVDWTLGYTNDASTPQSNVVIRDSTTINMEIVAGSLSMPDGWESTISIDNTTIDFTADTVTPNGLGYAISTQPVETNVSGGAGGGDGYVPLFGSDGNIYFTYHHRAGIIQCIDPDLGAVCPGYPIPMTVSSVATATQSLWTPSSADGTTVIGTRLYQAGLLPASDGNKYGLGCFDLVTGVECVDQPFIEFPHPAGSVAATGGAFDVFAQGPYVIGGNMYVWDTHQRVHCVDPLTWATCVGYPIAMDDATTFPALSAAGYGAGQVLGDQLFFGWGFSTTTEIGTSLASDAIRCFDPVTALSCAGWGSDGKTIGSGNRIFDLFFTFDAAGTATAVCHQSHNISTGGCAAISNGAAISTAGTYNGIPQLLADRIGENTGHISHAKHPLLNRSYFTSYAANWQACWDWSTGDWCLANSVGSPGDLNYIDTVGDGYVGDDGNIRPGNTNTREYGARYQTSTGCWWALGDANILWSFDDSGNVPCVPRTVEASGSASFANSFCRSGVPGDLVWTISNTSSFDPLDWASFIVTLSLPDGTVLGSYDPDAGTTSFDLSGVAAGTNNTVNFDIAGAMAPGRNPLDDPATTPIVTAEYSTAAGIEFCYQTRTVGDVCANPVATNTVEVGANGSVLVESDAQSFDIIADPVGKCFNPTIALEKSVYAGHDSGADCPGNELEPVLPGGDVTWCFSVTNTGDTDLDSVVITDPDLPGSPFAVTGQLAQGATTSLWIEGTAGAIDDTNTATVTGLPVYVDGTPIPGATAPEDTDTAAYDVREPSVSIAKTVYTGHDGGVSCATAGELAHADSGGEVTWCFSVTNTGDTDLDSVVITDPDLSFASLSVPGILAPTASASTFYEGTQSADLTNTATASGTPVTPTGVAIPALPPVSSSDTAEIDVVAPALTIAKTVSTDGTCPGLETIIVDPGDSVTWCFTVTNTGDTSLDDITITDPDLPGSPFDLPGVLAPLATATLEVPGLASVDLVNTATATATPTDPTGTPLIGVTPPTPPTDTAEIDVVGPVITLDKTVALEADGCAGVEVLHTVSGVDDAIIWCFTVTNAGDTSLADITITDPDVPGSPLSVPDLPPGASFTVAAPGIATISLLNTAQVTGIPVGSTGTPLLGVTPPTATDTAEIIEHDSSISGIVYHDQDFSAQIDPNESGIPSVTITMVGVDINGDPVELTTVTDASGGYTFKQLLPSGPGGYVVTVDEQTIPASLSERTTTQTSTVVLDTDGHIIIEPFGHAEPAQIIGVLYVDINNNGIQEEGEEGIPGVEITIEGTDITGRPVSFTLTTDESGEFDGGTAIPSDLQGYTVSVAVEMIPGNLVSQDDTYTEVLQSGETLDVPFRAVPAEAPPLAFTGSNVNSLILLGGALIALGMASRWLASPAWRPHADR